MPERAAHIIDRHFDDWFEEFRSHAVRHREQFTQQDWQGVAGTSVDRLKLYGQALRSCLGDLKSHLGPRQIDRDVWAQVRGHYSALRDGKPNIELAETFFNSNTRRLLQTVGVDPYVEFIGSGLSQPEGIEPADAFRSFEPEQGTAEMIRRVLESYDLGAGWENVGRDAGLVARRLEQLVATVGARIGRLDVLSPVFFRNKGAYLIGRLRAGDSLFPVILPVLHTPAGKLRVDTVLLTNNEAAQVFAFTRSYFAVDHDQPWVLVRFLTTLMPLKRIAELYIALGFVKHGKTELFRDITSFLAKTSEQFVRARGTRGMVMTVFTLPDYDIVFKLIKDRFDPVKQGTRQDVQQRYRFVALHDRVGRLADFQEYEHLEFDEKHFDPDLLRELLDECPSSVRREGNNVIVDHAYTERRVTPLNLYLQEANGAEGRAAVLDTGYAVKDLAAANIFPGDMLIKNFGVTRQGRVIFYDYDELGHLDDFHFRRKPQPRDDYEVMSSEAWFYVGPNDIFPEEIGLFMGFPAAYADQFRKAHADLMTVEFWHEMQARQAEGEPVDIFPYPPEKRFPPEQASASR